MGDYSNDIVGSSSESFGKHHEYFCFAVGTDVLEKHEKPQILICIIVGASVGPVFSDKGIDWSLSTCIPVDILAFFAKNETALFHSGYSIDGLFSFDAYTCLLLSE